MQSLGHFSGSFRLWVDALCTDQSNNEERTGQVAEMGRFYSTAWTMVAFLGPEAHDSSKAIDLVEDLASRYGR
jgi:acyl-CoA-binding protein